MRLRALLGWAGKLARGEVDLGRVHLKCGDPVVMGPHADVHATSRTVMAQLQEGTATSTHHLRCFLRHNPVLRQAEHGGVTEDWLRDAIEQRGGLVIDSPLDAVASARSGDSGDVDAVTELCMRYHWMHLLYPEAKALWPDHPAILHHTRQNGFHVPDRVSADLDDPRLRALLRSLFEPVARDYAQVAERLGEPSFAPRHASARSLLHEAPDAHLPYLQAAFEDLADRGIVVLDRKAGSIAWGPQAADIEAYKQACVWPEDRPHVARRARSQGQRAVGA
jgi:fatty acyl-CoA reductase